MNLTLYCSWFSEQKQPCFLFFFTRIVNERIVNIFNFCVIQHLPHILEYVFGDTQYLLSLLCALHLFEPCAMYTEFISFSCWPGYHLRWEQWWQSIRFKLCAPHFTFSPRLLHTSHIVFTNVTTLWFWPPMLKNLVAGLPGSKHVCNTLSVMTNCAVRYAGKTLHQKAHDPWILSFSVSLVSVMNMLGIWGKDHVRKRLTMPQSTNQV